MSHSSREPSPSSTGLGPSGFDPERKSLVEQMREQLAPHAFAVLRRSFEDADYNREYEQKRLSAWESPEYRPYCLRCQTMRRMEHRDYGYQCSVCLNTCAFGGGPASVTLTEGGDAKQAPALLSGAVGSEADETPR